MDYTLPDDDQRRKLCKLLHLAFVELRYINNNAKQVHDLAYAFHNLPITMYGWGTWSWSGLRAMLIRYREQFPDCGTNYVAMLDEIHPVKN